MKALFLAKPGFRLIVLSNGFILFPYILFDSSRMRGLYFQQMNKRFEHMFIH